MAGATPPIRDNDIGASNSIQAGVLEGDAVNVCRADIELDTECKGEDINNIEVLARLEVIRDAEGVAENGDEKRTTRVTL